MTNSENNKALDLEPEISQMLEQARHLRKQAPYKVRTVSGVKTALELFLADQNLDKPVVSDLKRLGGGASKEQFVFNLSEHNKATQR